jgi:parallel beta-helix repeat protein
VAHAAANAMAGLDRWWDGGGIDRMETRIVRRFGAMLITASLAGWLRFAAAAFAAAALATAALAATAQARDGWGQNRWGHDGGREILWASPNGGAGSCRLRAPCSLQNAVSLAPPGATVIALPGVYHGGVVVATRLTLKGWGAVIDAGSSPTGNGVQIIGPGGSGSTVEDLRIENAEFEGILVGTAPVDPSTTDGTPATSGQPVNDVTIVHNAVVHNDAGVGSSAGQCFSTPNAPGDCGEAIHLVSVTDSVVEDNDVVDNAGGILLTDEFGPTSGNQIRRNYTSDNVDDCGVTLAGHSSAAVDQATGQPTGTAGVFDNLVEDNVSDGNGIVGQGAGILLGAGAPFGGVYDNVIRDNVARGNGLAGVTIHQHLVGDLNGNVIERNTVANDNLTGDLDFLTPAPETTGILVGSGAGSPSLPTQLRPGPIEGTVIRGNRIFDVVVGIWTLGVDSATTTIADNFFGPGVTTPVSTN